MSHPTSFRLKIRSLSLVLLLPLIVGASGFVSIAFGQVAEEEALDPPEITNGERLFLETRFAQFFKVFLDDGNDVNDPLEEGDPILNEVVNWNPNANPSSAPGPFAGLSMNCRSCHFVDEIGVEEDGTVGFGMRTYTDFSRRSRVPLRDRDGKTLTVRNSPPLVNASLPRKNFFLHFDAEFTTMVDLIKSTLTGRNYGWLPDEQADAIAHIANVVRLDRAKDDLGQEFDGLSLKTMLTGTHPAITPEFLLPEEFRVDVVNASDEEIFHGVARLIASYTEDLAFSQDEEGNFNLSPYDVFLEKNRLPRQPEEGEPDRRYSRRLLTLIIFLERLGLLEFVTENPNTDDGNFQFHDQAFVFGEQELKGLKIFFSGTRHHLDQEDQVNGGKGNCISCHSAPNFTDFKFHNTGIAQAEYDGIHGSGSFATLEIPGLLERNGNPNEYLPATPQHPNAKEPFRSIPSNTNAQLTDLGLWNIFGNSNFPKPQFGIWEVLCREQSRKIKIFTFFEFFKHCGPRALLPQTIARFKTPGLRDLSHSAPFSHTGQVDTLEGVIKGYISNSDLARSGNLRNADPEMEKIALVEDDILPLKVFLLSLNEDYE